MTDATIGVIRGMSWPDLRPYAVSLSRCGFIGDKLIFVENVSPEVRSNLGLLGFTVIEVQTPPWEGNDRLLPEYWSYGYHRFGNVLRSLAGRSFRYLIWTDTRDVVFQTNPSTWLENNLADHKIAFAGLGHISAGCPFNDNWIRQAAQNDAIWEEVRQQETLACGTFAGEGESMLRLMKDCYDGCLNTPGAVDQGMFNLLMRTTYKDVTVVPRLETAFSAQWWPEKTASQVPPILSGYGEPVFDESTGEVRTKAGELFSIWHLYDRSPKWVKILREKYA